MTSAAKKLCTTAVSGIRRVAVEGNIGTRIIQLFDGSLQSFLFQLQASPPSFVFWRPALRGIT